MSVLLFIGVFMVEEGNDYQMRVEKVLAKSPKGVTLNQIAEAEGLSWATVKKYLDHLEGIGRVDVQDHGSMKIYYLNGHKTYQDKIQLNSKHALFLDTFISPFGEPFIRIKETKKKDEVWNTFGEIMITKDKIDDVIVYLEKVKKNIDKYKFLPNEK